jgi:branched-chain amino acid transport system permease protein
MRTTGADIAALLMLLALAALPLVAGLGGSGYVLSLAARAMVLAIAAIALDLILGYGALVSFGHAAFLGIGAYAVAILSAHGMREVGWHLAAAAVVALAFGVVTGTVSLRTKGVTFIMITLAFGQMAFFFASSLSAYGGDDGLTLPGPGTLAGSEALSSPSVLHYGLLATLAGVLVLSRAIVGSRFGRVLIGTRENAQRMVAIGFDPFRYQLVAYVISGLIATLAGVLLAYQTEFVSPAYMSWQRSGELIFMVVLGGVGTLTGPLIGAVVFLLLEEGLSRITEHWKLIFGPLLVLFVLLVRGGIAGLLGGRHG